MRFDSSLRAELLRDATSDQVPLVRLRAGALESAPLVGAVLEEQLSLADGRRLAFLTCDCPYEESLRIYLLDADLQVLDGLELGGAYVTGDLENFRVLDPQSLQFTFVHTESVYLQVDQEPSWMGWLWLTPGTRRLGGPLRRRYLRFSLRDS